MADLCEFCGDEAEEQDPEVLGVTYKCGSRKNRAGDLFQGRICSHDCVQRFIDLRNLKAHQLGGKPMMDRLEEAVGLPHRLWGVINPADLVATIVRTVASELRVKANE